MEITIFAKQRTTKDGNTKFWTYLTTLIRKSDGVKEVMKVVFRDEAARPNGARCPMNIEVDKSALQVSSRAYTTDDGEKRESKTLWISAWKEGSPYEDHSMDEYC